MRSRSSRTSAPTVAHSSGRRRPRTIVEPSVPRAARRAWKCSRAMITASAKRTSSPPSRRARARRSSSASKRFLLIADHARLDADAPHGRRFTPHARSRRAWHGAGRRTLFLRRSPRQPCARRPTAPVRKRASSCCVGPTQKAATSGQRRLGDQPRAGLFPQRTADHHRHGKTPRGPADDFADHRLPAAAPTISVIDQQLLRLRYGQFLGEELEDGGVADHAEVQSQPAPSRAAGTHRPGRGGERHPAIPPGARRAGSRRKAATPTPGPVPRRKSR